MLDKLNVFASVTDGATITTTKDAWAQCGDIIDLGAAGDAQYNEDTVVMKIHAAVTSSAGANVTFRLVSDSAATFDTGAGSTPEKILWTSPALAKATLVDNYEIAKFRLPKGCKRYLRVETYPDTTNLTAGKLAAYLRHDGAQQNSFVS